MSNNNISLPVCRTLSVTRMSTYMHAVGANSFEESTPLELYRWNAEISSAFFLPLHILEVTIRNAIADSISVCFGAGWPYDPNFVRRLPSGGSYNQQRDLTSTAARHNTTSKVIPELKFVFWEKMLTSRHDDRIWRQHFLAAFPNANLQNSVPANRQNLSIDLGKLRRLRNRIAHHEPIFSRNLQDDYDNILNLIELRCSYTSQWMDSHQKVTELLALRP